MPKVAVEATGFLDGISTISFPDDYGFLLKIKCCSCGELAPKPVVVSAEDEVQGVRGATVSLKLKCKFCKRVNDLKLLETQTFRADFEGEYQRILIMECRGCEPTELLFADDVPLIITGESGNKLEEPFLIDGEFYGYDDEAQTDVSVTEFETRVVKL